MAQQSTPQTRMQPNIICHRATIGQTLLVDKPPTSRSRNKSLRPIPQQPYHAMPLAKTSSRHRPPLKASQSKQATTTEVLRATQGNPSIFGKIHLQPAVLQPPHLVPGHERAVGHSTLVILTLALQAAVLLFLGWVGGLDILIATSGPLFRRESVESGSIKACLYGQ